MGPSSWSNGSPWRLADLADQIPSVDIQKEVENPSFVDYFWRKAMSFQHLMLVYIRGMIKLGGPEQHLSSSGFYVLRVFLGLDGYGSKT